MRAQRHYRASTWSGLLLALAALYCQPAGAQTVQLAKTSALDLSCLCSVLEKLHRGLD